MQYQKMLVVGNVGRAPARTKDESRVYFDVAVNEQYNGEERTTWYRVWTSNGLADTVEQYVVKGQEVLVEGRHHSQLDTFNNTVAIKEHINAATVRFGRKPSNNTDDGTVMPGVSQDDDGDEIPF